MITTLKISLIAIPLLVGLPTLESTKPTSSRTARGADTPIVIDGTVTAVYIPQATIRVAMPIGRDLPIHIHPSTILRKAGKRISLREIKTGYRVVVMYEVDDGINVARSVVVQVK
ncbi:MAG: hypothetical protein ACFCD0_01490 [Gemmataceae bacterium]